MAWLPLALLGTAVTDAWVLAADESLTSDPLTLLLSQGVLGVVVVMLWREYRDEKRKKEEVTSKMINDIVPLITRATEAIEREAARKGR